MEIKYFKVFLLFQVITLSLSLNVKVCNIQPLHFMQPQIQNNLKLPVWPVWAGVLAQISDWTGNIRLSELIVRSVGGRVVPITLYNNGISPFLLLAHHAHSFAPFDPIRALTTLFLPEGFPAHPHSGFDTVTYCIDGGLRHRDSEALKMEYGNGDVQWMRAGRGIIHEEMWNIKSQFSFEKIEIFQLWVNLPKCNKKDPSKSHLISAKSIPIWNGSNGESIRVVCGKLYDDITGTYHEGPGNDIAASPVCILHANIPNNGKLPLSITCNANIVTYVRRGSLLVKEDPDTLKDPSVKEVTAGDMVIYRNPLSNIVEENPESIGTTLVAGEHGLDALILIGQPLEENVIWNGPLVQENEEDWERSAQVFNSIGRNSYWDYKIGDEEWLTHVKKLRLQDIIRKFQPDIDLVSK